MLFVFFRDFYWSFFDDGIRRLLEMDGYGAIISWPDKLFFLILFVNILCYIGLFFFRKWAIWTLVGLHIIVSLILTPFSGLEVNSPLDKIAQSIYLMADGAILAIAFFSNLRLKLE